MKIPPLTPEILLQCRNAAPFLSAAKQIFESFAHDETLKKFFRPQTCGRPIVESTEGGDVWYGVDNSRASRWAHAAIFMSTKGAWLYAEVQYPGDQRKKYTKLKGNLVEGARESEAIWKKCFDYTKQKTYFYFTRRLGAKDDPPSMLEWFSTTFQSILETFEPKLQAKE